jgi:hypothetical protein
MAAKPTATLRVEWPEQKLIVNEIIVVNEDGRPVALKVLSMTPDPLGTDVERKLVEHARRVAAQAELVVIGKKRLAGVSRDGARYARKNIREAIERLQAFDHTLTEHIG